MVNVSRKYHLSAMTLLNFSCFMSLQTVNCIFYCKEEVSNYFNSNTNKSFSYRSGDSNFCFAEFLNFAGLRFLYKWDVIKSEF